MIDRKVEQRSGDSTRRTDSAFTGDTIRTRSGSGLLSARIMGAAMATALLSLSPLVPAHVDDESGAHWSHWEALGGGYVGRRQSAITSSVTACCGSILIWPKTPLHRRS